MNRCPARQHSPLLTFRQLALGSAALALASASLCASAQVGFNLPAPDAVGVTPNIRNFPANAKRGEMNVVAPPMITMNGQPDRLSPGARIQNMNRMLVLTGSLVNQPVVVNYTRDNLGQVQQVWILNSEEVKQKRPGRPRERNFLFGFEADEPAKDDGKTPYHLLPRYQP